MAKLSSVENSNETASVLGVEGTTVSIRLIDGRRIFAVVVEPLGAKSRTCVIRPIGCRSVVTLHYSEIFSAFISRGSTFESMRATAKAQRELYESKTEPTS